MKNFASIHPVSNLTVSEIHRSVEFVRALHPGVPNLVFKVVTLREPDKTELQHYFEAEASGSDLPNIDRRSFVNFYQKNSNILHEVIINLTKGVVESDTALDALFHPNGDYQEADEVAATAMADPGVRAEIAKLKLPDPSLVVCEPWIYGTDGINDTRRQYQCFLFCRHSDAPEELDSNHYAFPLAISPVVDVQTQKVVRIDIMPTGADNEIKPTGPAKIPPRNEYLPEFQSLRPDVKPLQVVQPEGAGFKVIEDSETGRLLQWQKWSFRLSFNGREGMVLHNVRYDGRPLIHRLSLSDMNIPYADPRHPYHRKAAFDLGDAGAGYMANNLKLGCDCLGSIYYLSAPLSNADGDIINMENCVCIHEQDNGIGWKHTNYRTGRAVVTRNRELVLQTILTVANYEYILAFIFNQAGEICYEVRATGILSTQPIDDGVDVDWGTLVHPGVLAAHHQHFFSLRIDPMIDGPQNTLISEETHPMPRSELNPHGTGYYTRQTSLETSGGLDLDTSKNRVFKILNTNVHNPVNKKAVGYKIMVPDFQKILADKDSYHFKRAEFADHNIYLTKYRPNELFSGGQYTNQSRGGTGVRSWADRKDAVANEDIVVWVQFGINHVPRIEDFPVMPCEVMRVMLKPVNFFEKNPAIDVPPSTQQANKSTLVMMSNGHDGLNGTTDMNGTAKNGHCNNC
ncbi:primary-amine oxidase [Capronia coronata CBS 617.96]|uniref:Amine oxidase n=1 Tax=Capronia coronata CBS 617.96 TaxID=1182541 RepID=W9XYP2_9EURO|nr:primary-amine oxidase [Capronia coronata CBS 617.96]EXJ85677.1 primary-amine oxidase [Capronia coronata CBS 617.96]